MSIDRIQSYMPPVKSIIPNSTEQVTPGQKPTMSFGEMMTKSLGEINALEADADKKIESLVAGKGEVSPHTAMLALEKADTAFQLMNQIRSKIIRVYEEIVRTQI